MVAPYGGRVEKDTMVIARVTEGLHWHALDDDEVVGRGHALHRPDGRVFLGVDSWRDDVFHQLVAVMLADLPAPVYTVVDEDDGELLARWRNAGFVAHRREREYVVHTDPRVTGLDPAPVPPGLTILPAGQAAEGPLRELDRVLRKEIGATWQSMPAEVLAPALIDVSRYVVAAQDGRYVGLARLTRLPRRPRLGLLAVRIGHRRRGVARALLAELLGSLHLSGAGAVSTEVDELNVAATALFEGIGARPVGVAVELRHR
jgi:RimJ/RimL family protein N-acetyltransferase